MNILVCGGAGYIGSHMVRWLLKGGHRVTVLDNLSTGHLLAVGDAPLVQADLLNKAQIEQILIDGQFDAVMHFCAKALVGESVSEPYTYYENNVVGTLNLLQAMRVAGVERFVFSSTCAVFGIPEVPRISEHLAKKPVNPYGSTKLVCEQLLMDAAAAYGLRSVSLRYFNAAGAAQDGGIGEPRSLVTRLIPNALRAALGNGPALRIFGRDYETPDGTCVRDYVHVEDLAYAHALALDLINNQAGAHVYNLGSASGNSVLEVIASVERVSGRTVPYVDAPRRPGDPPALVADSRLALDQLGWRPRFCELDEIVETAYRWELSPRY